MSVFGLSINQTTFQNSILQNMNYSFYANLTNNENETIYDIYIQPISYYNFSKIDSLQPNSSILYNMSVFTNTTLDTTLSSKLVWSYKKMLLSDSDIFYVNITESGFRPNNLAIDGNDVIIFSNIGQSSHTISEFNNLFSFDVSQNANQNLTFDINGNYTVVDEKTGYIMYLNISNATKLTSVHYSQNDVPISFRIISSYSASSLSNTFYTTDFTIDYNGYGDGVMQMVSNDNSYNIHFDMPWTTFSDNDFSLAKDQNKIITFRISPIVNQTSDTNKTHELNLKVTSSNTPSYNQLIKVSIPYQYLGSTDQNNNTVEFVYLFDEDKCYAFCDKYPDKCPLKTETKIEYVTQKDNLTITEQDLQNLKDDNARMRNEINGLTGKVSSATTSIDTLKQNISGDINSIKSKQDEGIETEQNRNVSVGISIVVIIIVLSIVALLYFIPKMMKQNGEKQFKLKGYL